ncbi:Cell surface mannoprotein mp65 [Parahypoxylon ruwenzoriense]
MRLTPTSLTLLSLLQLSAGQPRHRHAHQHRSNKAAIPKRDRITITDSILSATTELPEVVVYVDQYNNAVRTATETVVYVPISTEALKTPAPQTTIVEIIPAAPSAAPVDDPSRVAPQPTPRTSGYDSAPEPTPSAEPPTTSPPISGGNSLHGVTYSPYKGSGGCKTAAEVDADFAIIAKDYGVIRLYGVDCDQVATAYTAAKKYGNKLFLGIFDINSIDQAVSTMAEGVKYDWSIVDTVSVGNELVNNGGASASQSLDALNRTRSALRAAGYKGPVVIVDTFVAMLAHPELCEQSDYCAVNVHPFFDPNTGPHQAGSFVTSTVSNIRSKLSDPGKRVVVTETGWPWQGQSNGMAVPGMDQQTTAISSIKSAYIDNASDVILFTAFNDMWKKPDAGTFMAEQFWGMGGRYSPCDK